MLSTEKTGDCCFPAGGVMVRWPSSSREGGWQFEVLPSGVSRCITPCACAPLRPRFRGRSYHCQLRDGPLPEDFFCPQECRAVIDGNVQGLRFTHALQPTSILMDDDPNLLELFSRSTWR